MLSGSSFPFEYELLSSSSVQHIPAWLGHELNQCVNPRLIAFLWMLTCIFHMIALLLCPSDSNIHWPRNLPQNFNLTFLLPSVVISLSCFTSISCGLLWVMGQKGHGLEFQEETMALASFFLCCGLDSSSLSFE